MNEKSFVYKFLLSPSFRIWRYIILFLFFIIVSFNQALVTYNDMFPFFGKKIYLTILANVFVYIGFFYLTIRVFIPKYLLTGKYSHFVILMMLVAVVFTIASNISYIFYSDDPEYFSESQLVDIFSSFVIFLLCVAGVIIPVFLRSWMISNQKLKNIEKKRNLSQIEHLKEQINPGSFFKILNRSAGLVKSEPDKASSMLMKLSRLLRYQLYDCNRRCVLLTAEISFLHNFLELEKLYSPDFDYKITTSGNPNGIFIQPSVLLPFIQSGINLIDNSIKNKYIEVDIIINKETVSIVLKICGAGSLSLVQRELLSVRERLDTLYKEKYLLDAMNDTSGVENTISLILARE